MHKCTRCKGIMTEDHQWDLPGSLREYCCLNCGDRFWINLGLGSWVQGLHLVYQN